MQTTIEEEKKDYFHSSNIVLRESYLTTADVKTVDHTNCMTIQLIDSLNRTHFIAENVFFPSTITLTFYSVDSPACA